MNEHGCFGVIVGVGALLVGVPLLALMAQKGGFEQNALFAMSCGVLLFCLAFFVYLILPDVGELRRREIEEEEHWRNIRRIRRDE